MGPSFPFCLNTPRALSLGRVPLPFFSKIPWQPPSRGLVQGATVVHTYTYYYYVIFPDNVHAVRVRYFAVR